ncbi:Tetratricopeptide TPR_1 repeat-containing protein [Halothece sp. PCC 7418]|uniref:tetratricopeptide repeat protein n=1 Tax=Halothece sp. (strain PCC 7418) TaxID=65093 RepID=UPI0002A0858A|nr:tetratricopeptide repeat protein [Halothece sp. PCC 7418]AFZ45403.1 Tetratricopeptide TPR_1 repeat-containing protein [Halothece sp. PCC 7418]
MPTDHQPDPAYTYYKLGQALAHEKRWQEAIAQYRKALELNPNLSDARRGLEALLQKSSTPSAPAQKQPQAAFMPEKTPEGQQYRQQCQYYARNKQWQEAGQVLQKLLEVEPSFEAYRDLARVYQYLNQTEEATKTWYQAFQFNPKQPTAQQHLQLGNTFAKQKQWEPAIHCYQWAIERDPNLVLAHRNLGMAFARQEKWSEAVAACRRAIALNDQSALVYQELAVALERQEQWEEAIASYEQAIKRQPDDLSLVEPLLNLLEKRQDWEQLETVCRQGIEQDSQIARFHHLLGDALLHTERYEEAVAAYHNAISLNANFSWSHHNLGDALFKLERWEEAIEAYRSAIALKDDFAWSYYHLGGAALELERWEEALEGLQQAVQLDEELPAVEELLGDALRMRAKADLKKAVDYYRSAIAKNPDHEKLYHKALDAKPDDSDLYHQLATLLENKGNHQAAYIINNFV